MVFYRSTIRLLILCISSGSLLATLTRAEPLLGTNVTRVPIGKYPFVVAIVHENDRYPVEEMLICSGVLIAKKFVLTAAHCFLDWSLDEIRIVVGSLDLREGRKYKASMWITYNEWAERKNITPPNDLTDDIAIIKLSEKIHKRVAIPALLSSKKTKVLIGESVMLVGWGYTNDSPDNPPRHLHQVEIKVLPNEVCENILFDVFHQIMPVPDKFLCTKGEPHAFVTFGDSGAPVLRKNSVVGINTATCPKQGLCNLPQEVIDDHKLNLHVAVDSFREFITNVLRNY